jgi:Outer membrane lipoprotein-sorting protein
MIRLHLTALIAVALLGAPGIPYAEPDAPAAAQAPDGLAEAEACAQRNLPHQTLELRATFTKVDRVGGERVSRAKVIGKKLEDGLHRIVLRFDRPLDVRGTAMLMIEGANAPADFYVYSPDDRKVRRVSGRNPNGLFGTDFSYDDFENWRGFAKRGKAERLPDAIEADRPVYVIAGTPAPEDGSTYERVVTYIDRQECVILRIDSFEPGAKLRKVLRADPKSIKKEGDLSIATAIELRDMLDETSTRVAIDTLRLDVELPDRLFRQADLGSN